VPRAHKRSKNGTNIAQPVHFFPPFIGFCRSLLAERTATLGDCPKTILNAQNETYVKNVVSVIQAKVWPKKRTHTKTLKTV
jgi:hypothetical protein